MLGTCSEWLRAPAASALPQELHQRSGLGGWPGERPMGGFGHVDEECIQLPNLQRGKPEPTPF